MYLTRLVLVKAIVRGAFYSVVATGAEILRTVGIRNWTVQNMETFEIRTF